MSLIQRLPTTIKF